MQRRKALCLLAAAWMLLGAAAGRGETAGILELITEQAAEPTAEPTANPMAVLTAEPESAQPAEETAAPVTELTLTSRSPLQFTNVLLHYVYFDAEAPGAEKIVLRLYNPAGRQVAFRTRAHVRNGQSGVRSMAYTLKKGEEKKEGLNMLFLSEAAVGEWTIEVIASGKEIGEQKRQLKVNISEPRELRMPKLAEVHSLLLGTEGGETVPAEKGKIRYIAQNPKDPWFVKNYWFSGAFDLTPGANGKCTRAIFSMALSYLGIDCSPIRMSELVRSEEIEYNYDRVCAKIGNVERISGSLEELWARYEAGEASPVLLHFTFSGGMHAVLLVARDEEDPELFYAVTTGQRADTSAFPGGMKKDCVIPLLIEKGETEEQIQSPMIKRYHKARIDQIWSWKIKE